MRSCEGLKSEITTSSSSEFGYTGRHLIILFLLQVKSNGLILQTALPLDAMTSASSQVTIHLAQLVGQTLYSSTVCMTKWAKPTNLAICLVGLGCESYTCSFFHFN